MQGTKKIIFALLISTSTLCASDLLSTSTTCTKGSDPYCLSCQTDESKGHVGCGLCAASFIDKKTFSCKVPTAQVEYCGTYDSETQKCTDCMKGYFLTSDGFCVDHALPGCLDPLNQAQCRECDGLFMKSDKTCDLNAPCNIEGCSTCENQNGKPVCIRCFSDFVFSSNSTDASANTCISTKTELEGCAVIENGHCVACRFGFYVGSASGQNVKCVWSPAYESAFITNLVASLFFFGLLF